MFGVFLHEIRKGNVTTTNNQISELTCQQRKQVSGLKKKGRKKATSHNKLSSLSLVYWQMLKLSSLPLSTLWREKVMVNNWPLM